MRDLWIVPSDPQAWFVRNVVDQISTTSSAQPSSVAAGQYHKELYSGEQYDNLFLAVEHLLNQDGTIVPCTWDFYVDTSISVELDFTANGYQRGEFTASYNIPGYPTDSGTQAPLYYFTQPMQWQAIANNHHAPFRPLVGARNVNSASIVPYPPTDASSFGNRSTLNQNRAET